MDELKNYLETIIALTTKHISEDQAYTTDPYNKRFFEGRLVIEKNDLEIFKRIMDMVNKL